MVAAHILLCANNLECDQLNRAFESNIGQKQNETGENGVKTSMDDERSFSAPVAVVGGRTLATQRQHSTTAGSTCSLANSVCSSTAATIGSMSTIINSSTASSANSALAFLSSATAASSRNKRKKNFDEDEDDDDDAEEALSQFTADSSNDLLASNHDSASQSHTN